MSEFQPFMERSCGRWISHRRYLFGKKLTSGEYVTEFDIHPTEDYSYKIAWSGKTEGEMDVTLKGNRLERSRSYFNSDDDSGYQEMHWIDPDTLLSSTLPTMGLVSERKFVSSMTTHASVKLSGETKRQTT